MHQRGSVLRSLDKVRHNGFVEQDHHGSGTLEIAGANYAPIEGETGNDVVQAAPQVGVGIGQGKDRHYFGGGRDDEAGFTRHAVDLATEPYDYMPKSAIVHIDSARPENVVDIDAEPVVVMNVRIDHRSEQVMRRRHGVEVTIEVQVDQFTGDHLRLAAAGSSAFEPENRSEGRLPQGDAGVAPYPVESLSQSDGDHRLPFAMTGGRYGVR